jgi:hypothetical protein
MKRICFLFKTLLLSLFSLNLSAQLVFNEYVNNPVIDTLSTTDPSEFWTQWKTDPFVIPWQGDSLRMYYGTNNIGVKTQIGTAVSADGNIWIEKRDEAVVPSGIEGSWDEYDVETPGVIIVPSNPDSMRYMLYYSGATADEILLDEVNPIYYPTEIYQMGMAYSPDGINFTKYNDPTNDSDSRYAESDPVIRIPYTSGDTPDTINYLFSSVAEPSPMYDEEEGIFKLWYIGLGCSNPTCSGDENYRFRVLYSESDDGINWTDPVVALDVGGTDDFDSKLIYAPNVIKHAGQYWMFYGGNHFDTGTFFLFSQKIGLATSTDGVNFSRYEENPIILDGELGSWNDMGSNYPCAIEHKDTLRVYYSGFQDSVITFDPNIGYSYLDPASANLEEQNPLLEEWILYPNPSSQTVHIKMNNVQIDRIRIYDQSGRICTAQYYSPSKNVTVDLAKLTNGMYWVYLYRGEEEIGHKKLMLH